MKKLLFSLLCLIIIILSVSAVNAGTIAAGTCGAQGDNLTWTLD